MGININDQYQPFTEQILNGIKTIETRNSKSLHPYLGKHVGLIRTGKGKAMLVGYATLAEHFYYYTEGECFDDHHHLHMVKKESPYHISKSSKGIKYGYELLHVERIEPVEVNSKGIVARRID